MKKASANFSMPLLMMGYFNTVFSQGEEAFLERLQAAGDADPLYPTCP